MSTITKVALEERLRNTNPVERLVITPMLTVEQVGGASIDVRLGNQFILFHTHTFGAFDKKELTGRLRAAQERFIVPYGGSFVLHPGMLVLAATLEYFSLPYNLECQIEGRSSWARVGLQIATASTVEPLFKGVVTLELSNVGTIPLRLHPGIRIAQAVFHDAVPSVSCVEARKRKYHGAIGPEFSKVHEDKDIEIFSQTLSR
ncbi:MAG: dCTP deaminase [Candidatus Hydrogenedentes bacterium]|nr:dCTP deaminase [Candidatus Hydrogenedentota bacterium]